MSQREITDFLDSKYPKGYSAKQLSFILGVGEQSVHSNLKKMREGNTIAFVYKKRVRIYYGKIKRVHTRDNPTETASGGERLDDRQPPERDQEGKVVSRIVSFMDGLFRKGSRDK